MKKVFASFASMFREQKRLLLSRATSLALSALFAALASAQMSAPPPAAATTPSPADAKPVETKPVETKAAEPKPAAAESAKPAGPSIVLLLPTASKALGPAAEALRAGFVAGATAEGATAVPHQVVSLENDGSALATAYRNAVKGGAVAIVAGLTRDGASVTARESGLLPTLALNQPSTDLKDGAPGNFALISLALEGEARALAQHMRGEGLAKLVIVHTNTASSKRIQEVFEREWLRAGGEVALRVPYIGDAADGEAIQRALDRFSRMSRGETGPSLDRPLKPPKKLTLQERKEKAEKGEVVEKPERPEFAGADAIFLIADTSAARLARPYFPPGVLVYAASTALDSRAGPVQNVDLDGVRFLEMPWFAQPDHPAVMTYAKPETDLPIDYERLYALGIDAWRAINAMLKQPKPGPGRKPIPLEPIDGVTGRLVLDGYQFTRGLTLIDMRDGRPHVVGKPD